MRSTRLSIGRSAREWLVLALVFCAIGLFFTLDLRAHHEEVRIQEEERLAMHALAVERMLLRQLAATDAAINSVVEDLPEWWSQPDGTQRANRRLQVLSDTLDGIRNVFVTDARGQVIASNKVDAIGRDVSDRAFFKTAAQGHDPRVLYVAPPFSSRNAGYVMNFNRVVARAPGRFDGMVVAGADPEYFNTLLDSVCYAPDVQASIIHGDGVFFLSMPPRPEFQGVNMVQPGTLFARFREEGNGARVLTGATATGEVRLAALRSIQTSGLRMDRPLVVSVSRDYRAVYAPWYREVMTDATLYMVLLLGAVTSLAVYQRRRKAFADLTQQHEQARLQADRELRAHTRTLELLSASMLQHREDEKARLALDLHEGVAQTLSAIKVNLEALAHQLTGRLGEAPRGLEPALESVRQAIVDVRDMATELRPPSLDNLGFLATLRALLGDYRERYSHIEMHEEIALRDAEVPVRLGIILYRVIDDVGQHLAAVEQSREVNLVLSRKLGQLELRLHWETVSGDDTMGVSADWGTVRELVILSGGAFTLDATDARTRTLAASWPITDDSSIGEGI